MKFFFRMREKNCIFADGIVAGFVRKGVACNSL